MQSLELESLLENIEWNFQQLAIVKNDVQKQLTHSHYPETSPINYLERAIRLRQSFRNIAEGIEAKRNLAQLQKQKIQQSRNFVQGLQYYKTTLINKIKECQTEVINISQYYSQLPEINDWIEDYPNMESNLNDQLRNKAKKNVEYQELLKIKASKQQDCLAKKELYQKILPQNARKIYDEVIKTAELLDTKELESISGIASHKLSILYEKINPLRINNTISVTFTREIYEQLQITILKKDSKLYKQANANKIILNEPQTKIIIASLQPNERLVVGVDRREDYTHQEIFQRLINNQLAKPIFPNPKTQNERNFNAKYIRLDWLEDALLTGVLSPLDFILAIKERIFTLGLVSFMCENFKKLSFYFPLATSEQTQNNLIIPLNFKKVTSGSLQRIKFEQYLELMHIPNWVEKYKACFQELQNQRRGMNFQEKRKFTIDKSKFSKAIQILGLQQIDESSLNSYFKGTISIYNYKLDFVLIVPFSFPQKPSKIKIHNWQKKKDEQRKINGLQNVPCRAKINTAKKSLMSNVMEFQSSINNQIDQFIKSEESKPFMFLLQINRLITLLGINGDKKL